MARVRGRPPGSGAGGGGRGTGRGLLPAGALSLFLFLLFAWGGGPHGTAVRGAPTAPLPPGPRVAVAPMENRSNDLDAEGIIRGAFVEEARGRGWNVVPPAESDLLLRESLGISYGGQLGATTPGEVCRALGVEGVFYGEVLEWNKTTTGFYNAVAVEAHFRLFGKDGALLWEGTDRQDRKVVPSGGSDLGGQVIGHAVFNLLLNPMSPYGRNVGRGIARKLPPGLPASSPRGGPEAAGSPGPARN
jgi:hypothetical protein